MPTEALELKAIALDLLQQAAEKGWLYAILDSCDEPAVPLRVAEMGEGRAVCLFRGPGEDEYSAIAPYLLKVDAATLHWIVSTLWNAPWGVFAMSKADLEPVRHHLRRFLLVQLPDGARWFFRYYDPRVLKTYLSSCTDSELQRFFGPVRGYGIKDDSGKLWLAQGPANAGTPPAPGPGLWQIRSEQVAALDQAQLEGYCERVIAHLRESYPELMAKVSDDRLRAFITEGIEMAARYHIRREIDVTRFLHLAIGLTPQFEADPRLQWVVKILQEASLNAEQRLDLISERLRFVQEVADAHGHKP